MKYKTATAAVSAGDTRKIRNLNRNARKIRNLSRNARGRSGI